MELLKLQVARAESRQAAMEAQESAAKEKSLLEGLERARKEANDKARLQFEEESSREPDCKKREALIRLYWERRASPEHERRSWATLDYDVRAWAMHLGFTAFLWDAKLISLTVPANLPPLASKRSSASADVDEETDAEAEAAARLLRKAALQQREARKQHRPPASSTARDPIARSPEASFNRSPTRAWPSAVKPGDKKAAERAAKSTIGPGRHAERSSRKGPKWRHSSDDLAHITLPAAPSTRAAFAASPYMAKLPVVSFIARQSPAKLRNFMLHTSRSKRGIPGALHGM
jgi:hypothetical protein